MIETDKNKKAYHLKQFDRVSSTGAMQRVYSLTVPLKGYEEYDDEGNALVRKHHMVMLSQLCAPFSGWETYIFPVDENGEVTDWGELPGSYRGYINHEELLKSLGYTVVEPYQEEREAMLKERSDAGS